MSWSQDFVLNSSTCQNMQFLVISEPHASSSRSSKPKPLSTFQTRVSDNHTRLSPCPINALAHHTDTMLPTALESIRLGAKQVGTSFQVLKLRILCYFSSYTALILIWWRHMVRMGKGYQGIILHDHSKFS